MKLNSLDLIIVTELANTMKYGGGALVYSVFTEFPFKTVSGDVTAFQRFTSTSKNMYIH